MNHRTTIDAAERRVFRRPREEPTVHIVTKILIVFCAVLSLLLAALTMAYAANANVLRTSIKAEQNLKNAALADAAQQVSQTALLNLDQSKTIQSLQAMLAAKEQDITSLNAERTQLRTDVQRSQADADRSASQIAQLNATTQTQAALIKNYRDEVTTLRETDLSTQRRSIDLQDKINDLGSQREVLEQNARALKEQLEELKLANSTLAQNAASGGVTNMASKTMAPRELPGPIVRARVSEVFRSPAGDDMVVISEGSNRGLKENIQMNISRGDAFVATIVLTRVEPTKSVGRVTFKPGTLSVDDTVLSRLE